MIHVVCPSRYKVNKKDIRTHAGSYLASRGAPNNAALTIVFIGTRKMKQIANQYKQEDVALPVLAFPYDENPSSDEHLIGEILMCYPQVVLLAAERNKRVEDMITQLIEHGIRNILK
jgi:rRNA maturation RNase YbeY